MIDGRRYARYRIFYRDRQRFYPVCYDEVGEYLDLPHRLLQIVRRDIVEGYQLLIASFQLTVFLPELVALLYELELRSLFVGDVADKGDEHRLACPHGAGNGKRYVK